MSTNMRKIKRKNPPLLFSSAILAKHKETQTHFRDDLCNHIFNDENIYMVILVLPKLYPKDLVDILLSNTWTDFDEIVRWYIASICPRELILTKIRTDFLRSCFTVWAASVNST